MRYSEIKVKNIYYANLRPSKEGEFGDLHLCLVVSKSLDEKTVNIISLTSKKNLIADEDTKYKLSNIINLPNRLALDKEDKKVDSYCLLNQIRNVSVSRIEHVLNGRDSQGNSILSDCYVDDQEFKNILYKFSEYYPGKLLKEEENFENDLKKISIYYNYRLKQICYDVLARKMDFGLLKDEFFYLHSIATSVNPNFDLLNTLNTLDKENGIGIFYQDIMSQDYAIIWFSNFSKYIFWVLLSNLNDKKRDTTAFYAIVSFFLSFMLSTLNQLILDGNFIILRWNGYKK